MGKGRTLVIGIALGLAVFAAPTSAATFNGGAIAIPSTGSGQVQANPYGTGAATINVSGTIGTITDLNIGFTGFSHTWTDDVAAALVAPNGAALDFLDGAGGDGAIGTQATSLGLLFDDSGTGFIPETEGALAGGTYTPTDRNLTSFPAPGPPDATLNDAGPVGASTLGSVFNGLSANGTWKLFVVDNVGPADGGLIGSWRLEMSGVSVPPPVTVAPTATGLRAAALKKCKKRYRKNHDKKKFRKCKKRARRLPV